MLEAEQTSAGQMCVGATFRGTNKVMGRRMAWTSKATECKPNKKWGETVSSGNKLIKGHLTFDSVGGGAKFTEGYDMKVGGFLKRFALMVINEMNKQMKTNLSKLKTLLRHKLRIDDIPRVTRLYTVTN